ncbi:MAG: phage portal protein, partial [Methanothrix sp.]
DRLVSMIYAVTDLNPAAIGDFSGGAVASGSALRRLLLRTISHCNRIRVRFDQVLKRAIKAASILDVNGRIKDAVQIELSLISWQDGLPSDDLENSMIEQTRANSGLTSRSSAIMRLDGCTREEADQEMERISQETPKETAQIPVGNGAKPVPKSGQDITNASKQGGSEKAPLMPDIISTLKDIGYFKTNSG